MKAILIFLFFIMTGFITENLFAQRVYVTEWKSEADKKIYVTE